MVVDNKCSDGLKVYLVFVAMRIDQFLENWQGQTKSVLGDVPVSSLSFPGTHDSNSYDLTATLTSQSSLPPRYVELIRAYEKISGVNISELSGCEYISKNEK